MESALMRIMKPEVDEIVNNKIMEIVKNMIIHGADNNYITLVINVPENEIDKLRNDSK